MYLFTRSARLAPGNLAKAQAWAQEITEKVNQVTELDVSLWTPVFSAGIGTLTWVAMVQDLAELEASDAKLMVDNGFVALSDEGAKFMTNDGLNDTLTEIVSPVTAPPADAPKPMYALVVETVLAPGQASRGVELGLKIAELASSASGVEILFGASVTGAYGGVSWIGDCETIQQLEHAQQAIGTDPALNKLLDGDASNVYQPTATRTCYRRVI
jgi:hypothetical protein